MFHYVVLDNRTSLNKTWLLQVLEAMTNVLVGFVVVSFSVNTVGVPKRMFVVPGIVKLSAKDCVLLVLSKGLRFPVTIFAKIGIWRP